MSRRNNVIQPKLVRIGNQVVDAASIEEVSGRSVRLVIASKTADFKASHREVSNGALIGTLKSIDGSLTFNAVDGSSFDLSPAELAGVSLTLSLSHDMIEDIIDELGEFPVGTNGGRAAELVVTIDVSAGLTDNTSNDGGVIGKVIGSNFSLSGVTREKEVADKNEALTQLQANLQKNRGVQEESRRRRRMTMPTETNSAAVEPVAESTLPPVVA